MTKFSCNGCGACCRRVYLIPDFPEPLKEDGSCEHLQEDNSCGIYETRPLICKIDDFYDKHLSGHLPREEFHRMNAELCKQYQDEESQGHSIEVLMES